MADNQEGFVVGLVYESLIDGAASAFKANWQEAMNDERGEDLDWQIKQHARAAVITALVSTAAALVQSDPMKEMAHALQHAQEDMAVGGEFEEDPFNG